MINNTFLYYFAPCHLGAGLVCGAQQRSDPLRLYRAILPAHTLEVLETPPVGLLAEKISAVSASAWCPPPPGPRAPAPPASCPTGTPSGRPACSPEHPPPRARILHRRPPPAQKHDKPEYPNESPASCSRPKDGVQSQQRSVEKPTRLSRYYYLDLDCQLEHKGLGHAPGPRRSARGPGRTGRAPLRTGP